MDEGDATSSSPGQPAHGLDDVPLSAPQPLSLKRLTSTDVAELKQRRKGLRKMPMPPEMLTAEPLQRFSSSSSSQTFPPPLDDDVSVATLIASNADTSPLLFQRGHGNRELLPPEAAVRAPSVSTQNDRSQRGEVSRGGSNLRVRRLRPNPKLLSADNDQEHLGTILEANSGQRKQAQGFWNSASFRGCILVCASAGAACLLSLDTGMRPVSAAGGLLLLGCVLLVVYDWCQPRYGAGRAKAEKEGDGIDWTQKMRISVGDVGLHAFNGKGGHLQEKVDTLSFRDTLLEYANQFWSEPGNSSTPPSQLMALEVIDYGDIETKSEDGKVSTQMQKEPLLIPMQSGHVSAHKPQAAGYRKNFRWLHGHNGADAGEDAAGGEEGYAKLTRSGDIQLVITFPESAVSASADKEKEKDKDGGKAEAMPSAANLSMFLDVYGQDGFEKVRALVKDVLQQASSRRPQTKKIETERHKQLYWYNLVRWDESGTQPIFKKSPMHGDREYQMNYHHSFFHPKKIDLLGTSYSLLDQFRDRTGNYAVRGAQQKLNLLLHGPPGTGKSKFVRTMAMYLQRHVVSFMMSQVETELHLMTLLDDLKAIDWNMGDFTYKDLLFVVEEIDTDPRGICMQRPAGTALAGPAPVQPTEEEEGEMQSEEEKSKKKQSPKKGKGKKQVKDTSPELSLGLILRTLDGGSETPGRVIVMTSNRVEALDEAFTRPGRMKKVQMDNLAYPEFKQMILHFRQSEGHVPTGHLWTRAVDEMANKVMEDFQHVHAQRVGDLDDRSLGLSPALLEELCMESQSLKQLFHLLKAELQRQWSKAKIDATPGSAHMVQFFNWRMNVLRQTVLFHIKDPVKHAEASNRWPETPLPDTDEPLEQVESGSDSEMEIPRDKARSDEVKLAFDMLRDEKRFNRAIELCPQDHSDTHEDVRYRLVIALALSSSAAHADLDLSTALALLLCELRRKWATAWGLHDIELQNLLDSESPPSCLSGRHGGLRNCKAFMNTLSTQGFSS